MKKYDIINNIIGDFVYHGSPKKLKRIKPSGIYKEEKNGVFLSPYKGVASLFVIDTKDLFKIKYKSIFIGYKEWNSRKTKQQNPLKNTTIYHNDINAKPVKGKSVGYIYTIDKNTLGETHEYEFNKNDQQEFICDDVVEFISSEKIIINWVFEYSNTMLKEYGKAIVK